MVAPGVPPEEPRPRVLGQNEPTFHALHEMIARHPTLFSVPSLLDETQYVLTHPSEVRHVLLSNHQNYRKGRTFRNMKLLMGNGLIVQDGDFWRQQRQQIQPLFHEQVLAQTEALMRASTARLLSAWSKSDAPFNLSRDLRSATLDALLEALFSVDVEPLRTAFALLTDDPSRQLDLVPKFRAALSRVLELVERRHRENLWPNDFLSMLSQSRGASGAPMSAGQLCDEVATLIVAGHETSAAMLAWVWFLLSKHGEVEAKFHRELDEARGEAKYLKMIVFEALRLYPPVWLEDRQAINDDVIGAFQIPAGAEVFIPIYFLHRDARFFERPTAFEPERFEHQPLERRYALSQSQSSGDADVMAAFLPFGTGPRRCIGDQFALLYAQIHLQMIGQRLTLRHVGGEPELEPKVNLRSKNDLQMTATPRARAKGQAT